MNTGFGPFYDGLTHLFVTPEDLLPVIALALLAGLHGPRFGRAVLFALPAAWLAGSVLGLLVAPHVTMPVVTAAVTIAVGAMVAAGRPLPLALVAGFAVALGLLAGALNGIDLATAHSSPLGAAGVTAALFVVVSLARRAGGLRAGAVGARGGAGGGQLDRRDRPVHAGLGGARALRRHVISTDARTFA